MNRNINLGHVFIVALALSRTESGILALIFLLFAGLLPHLIADLDEDIIIIYPVQGLVLFLYPLLPDNMLVTYFVVIITYVLIFILAHETDDPLQEQVRDDIVPFLLSFVYLTFYPAMLTLLQAIL
jgi:hypothetical protein